jgi:hypothetical protein
MYRKLAVQVRAHRHQPWTRRRASTVGTLGPLHASPIYGTGLTSTLSQVTCVKSSQGFDWNQGETVSNILHRTIRTDICPITELFLPSYANREAQDLEHRPDPVEEIVLTDEEAAAVLPQ